MENQEEQLQEEPKTCDQALKPPLSPKPAGMSPLAEPICNTTTGQWEWYDPQVAP